MAHGDKTQNVKWLGEMAETGKIPSRCPVEHAEFLTGVEFDDFTTAEEIQEAAEGRLSLLAARPA